MPESALQEQLATLRSSILDRPPYCSAANACDAATFGLGEKDVLDESCRKAGTLDLADFAPKFDAERVGLVDAIHSEFMEGKKERRPIRVELYKLNVYAMFGSLAVIFPTTHEGGALVLRHNEKEWQFDSCELLSQQSEFDVEHEVLHVKSDYRVTLTYNLYFSDAGQTAVCAVPRSLATNDATFGTALRTLLDDLISLPGDGCLGSGLYHQYTLKAQGSNANAMEAERRNYWLSFRTSKGLTPLFATSVENLGWIPHVGSFTPVEIMCDEPYVLDMNVTIDGTESLCEILRYNGGLLLNTARTRRTNYAVHKPDIIVRWVTKTPAVNFVKHTYMAYGNEMTVAYSYSRICLLVKVGKAGERGTTEKVKE
ncbi:hypothetical protein OBBRIDRAFT_811453 [Obba rivulosa]|uniref:Uncharacterized protein n=1 Tax=Obba rivulosa TaxID=1052685 RepID=A0A8E2B5Z8_9APHY|nr:hypothetical protein OBBRIDRAFT_811453 [Obba rivulosa]